MKIEKVTIEDAAELLQIYGYYIKNTAIAFDYDVPTLGEFQQKIIDISSKYPFIKAVDNGEILGYAYANTFKDRKAYDWSVETTIYVKQDKRRMGIGKSLYLALEQALKNMGILNMNACIAVPQKEDKFLTFASYHFHKKMGFTLAGRFHKIGYKFNNWYDIVWMEKLLGEHPAFPPEVQFGKWPEQGLL
ncbi:MAG: N-acetyltransferase [Firmicutes bacterium]|nr:N-acetyltransferase [Bacillota bacterium]